MVTSQYISTDQSKILVFDSLQRYGLHFQPLEYLPEQSPGPLQNHWGGVGKVGMAK